MLEDCKSVQEVEAVLIAEATSHGYLDIPKYFKLGVLDDEINGRLEMLQRRAKKLNDEYLYIDACDVPVHASYKM